MFYILNRCFIGFQSTFGKYVGNRPIKLRKSSWRDRNIEIVRKKDKEKKRLGLR
uniref:RNA-binding protein 42 n=1 Tax=Magallana gigas TaxID=29159 RepID=K1PWS1_MAGGI